ncbi:lantibiotic dehydratase family protein [Streptomyces sp. TRM49041]|uniref:lantibiotic dehydratase family protein n=1 Tax=Streptomyces sp. TRM49041 TaxID=2603216 RepID=UPI0021CCA11E|nr:lantibiotic dehydratase family protein [Streptomyces sp. TRM49041]
MPFMLRVAGLPVETVRELRCPDSRRWADDVLATREELGAAGAALGELLHPLVGRSADDGERRRLLKLRRDVFNNRLPPAADADAAQALVAGLDPAVGGALADWLAARRRLTARTAEGAALLAAETARSRAALCRLAGEERLRKGLLLASPTLDAQLDAYVWKTAAAPDARPDKRRRKIERSLLSYLYRTACKTSPFSTFTGVVPGEFTDRTAQGLEARIAQEWTGHARLNVVALRRLAEALVADPARRADLPVSLASGWGRDDDRVRYVRRWVTAGDDDTAVTFDAVKDRLFFLRRSGTLERLLGLFEEREVVRFGELTEWLAADRGAGEEECALYLQALLDVGMVQVPCLRTEVHDTDPLRAFQASLRDLGRPWADALAGRLDAAVSCVDRFGAADPAERRALLDELRAELRAVQEMLGAAGQARVPQTVLYEDAAAGSGTALGRAAWAERVAGPLGEVERILPAFDLTLPQRITFKGFFIARYGLGGRCDDLLKLVHEFHEDFFDQYMTFTVGHTSFDADGRYVPEVNWLGLPQLKALDSARETFAARMRALWEGREGDEIVVGGDLIDAVAAELAPVAPDFLPMSHHLQLAADRGHGSGTGPLAVLNRSYGGLSFPFSRFTHCFDGVEDRLLRRAEEIRPEGAVFAEVTGGPVTSNLNLHGRLTEYEIVCPGERGTLEPEFRIPLDDLFIEHDVDADRLVLRSVRLGREVIPVYLGYLVPLALPELPRTLLLLSPTSMAPLNVWGGVPEGEPDRGVTTRPRVRHGSVVLSRRSWSCPAARLPLAAPGVPDADRFLGWHRFRRAHGLPDRVFATLSDSGARGATGAKPQYVDFDSALSLSAFEALIRTDRARVVFRETLPDENALHTVSDRGRHVAELAVETLVSTRTTGRDGHR